MAIDRTDVTPAVVCRPVNPADLDAVARIWLDGWQSTGIALAAEPTYEMLRLRIEREIAGDRWHVVVADRNGTIVGFVAMSLVLNIVEQIFVAPAFHRQGLGTVLLTAARQALPSGFTLWTHGENTAAARFYEKRGMALIEAGTHPKQGHPILTYAFGGSTR